MDINYAATVECGVLRGTLAGGLEEGSLAGNRPIAPKCKMLSVQVVENDGDGKSRHWRYRYPILTLVCCIKICLNFVFDSPAGMEDTIIETMKVDVAQYNLMYSVYMWPTVLTTFAGGVLIDRYLSLRLGVVIFVVMLLFGQLLVVIGACVGSFPTMVAARFFCGVGGDLSLALTDALCSIWFRNRELTFMVAILAFGCRAGGSLTLFSNQFIYDRLDYFSNSHVRLGVTFMVAFTFAILCFILSLIVFGIDKRGERLGVRHAIHHTPFSCKAISEFGVLFWLACGSLVVFFTCFFPFVDIAQGFIVSKYGLPITSEMFSQTLIYIASMFSPISGAIINWTGYNIYWGIAGMHSVIALFLLYGLTPGNMTYIPYVCNIQLGLTHTVFNSAMWATPVLLVSDQYIASAFALMQSSINLGIACTSVASGLIVDSYGYFVQNLVFVWYSAIGIACLWGMLLMGAKDHPVNMSGRTRRKLLSTNIEQSAI